MMVPYDKNFDDKVEKAKTVIQKTGYKGEASELVQIIRLTLLTSMEIDAVSSKK